MVRRAHSAAFRLRPVSRRAGVDADNRTELDSEALNLRLQQALNPPHGGVEVERFGWKFRAGDKVIQTQNNYKKEVFNGDIGRIRGIEPANREVSVDFDGKGVVYDFGELDELSLAYALTIHKAQGSEYPAVVMPLHTQHFLMLQRNLFYTGVTRGKTRGRRRLARRGNGGTAPGHEPRWFRASAAVTRNSTGWRKEHRRLTRVFSGGAAGAI